VLCDSFDAHFTPAVEARAEQLNLQLLMIPLGEQHKE
jgi:hypothetical protein